MGRVKLPDDAPVREIRMKKSQGPKLYTKVKSLGKGSFGTVFLVAHKESGELLVMKEVWLRGLSQQESLRQAKEVSFLKRLNHPHLTAYRASHVETSSLTLFIILEYCDGGDLGSRIVRQAKKGPPFAEPLAVKWLAQCASALAYCHHELKLLHRDIKPANVLLTGAEDDVKIADFGLSKSLAASHMQANTQLGTPLYMSPELCQGAPYDRSADVWALGCTLYHAMALQPPWSSVPTGGKGGGMNGMMSLIRRIIAEPLDFAPLRSHFSEALCGLVASMVAKEQSARPQLLREVLGAPLVRASPGYEALVAWQENRQEVGMLAAAAAWFGKLMGGDGDEGGGGRGGEGSASGPNAEARVEVAAGIEVHAAAAVLQRSFHRRQRLIRR